MKRALAALCDVVLIAVLGYGLFRLAGAVSPCNSAGQCPFLAPLVVLFLLAMLGIYFGGGYLRWRCTPGERLFLR